jgi:hypothetical protein
MWLVHRRTTNAKANVKPCHMSAEHQYFAPLIGRPRRTNVRWAPRERWTDRPRDERDRARASAEGGGHLRAYKRMQRMSEATDLCPTRSADTPPKPHLAGHEDSGRFRGRMAVDVRLGGKTFRQFAKSTTTPRV